MKRIKMEYWTILFVSALAFVMYLRMKDIKAKYYNLDNFNETVNATLKVVRNRDSSTTATIQSITTNNFKQFQKIKSQDSLIKRLQKLNKNTQMGVTFNTNTEIVDNTPTKSIISRDTVWKDSLVYIYPEYKHSYINKWYQAESITNKDTGYLSISIKNDYDVSIEHNRSGYIAVVHSLNPYSQTKEVRSVNLGVPKPKRFGLGIQGGYGLSTDFKPKPYVGIGVNYSIINLF